MKNLPKEIRSLIQLGYYSLYRLDDNRIILWVPATSDCCSLRPHDSFVYLINEDGDILDSLSNNIEQYKVIESIKI